MAGPWPLVVAHRGASHGLIDNSREAFELAIQAGADMIEFDVRRTRDGQLIAFHDAGAAGRPIGSLTREEVATAVGHRPLLVGDVLELAQGRIGLDVELKEDGYVREVVESVRERFEPGEVVLTSFFDQVVATARREWPEVRAGLIAALGSGVGDTPRQLVERARRCGATALALEHALVVKEGLQWTFQAGLEAYVWTVNELEPTRALLADPCLTGLITDVPARAVALRDELRRDR